MYVPRPNERGGMAWSLTHPVGLKVEEAMASAEINAKLVCPLRSPKFLPGTHEYNLKRHSPIEHVSKCMFTRDEAHSKFNKYHSAQGPNDDVYTNGSPIDERMGMYRLSIAISWMVKRLADTCPKR